MLSKVSLPLHPYLLQDTNRCNVPRVTGGSYPMQTRLTETKSQERPLDPKVMAYRQVLRLSRKMGIATLVASQKETDVLRDIRRWSTFHVEKLDPSRPDQTIVDMEGEIEGQCIPFYEFLRGVPPTSLPFRTEAIGSFVVDMDPLALLQQLSKADMEANQFRVTLDWLDDMGYEFTREEKQYLARRMYGTGKLSQQDVGDVLGVGNSTVSRWVHGTD